MERNRRSRSSETRREGTRWSARSGVVGRAVLQGKVAAMIRDGSFDEYVQTLVENYAMHQREARSLPDDRYSFVAVPIRWRGSGPVIGVIYFDSTDATFFSEPASPRGDISQSFVVRVSTACAGLGLYTELRYAMEAGR
jgi:hypothetical protein